MPAGLQRIEAKRGGADVGLQPLGASDPPAGLEAIPSARAITREANKAATSPKNDLPQPTDGQKEAGTYRKGHVRIHGLDIAIENPKGSKRSGKGPDGTEWSVRMPAHYGYVRSAPKGADGDHVDVYLGDEPKSLRVWVVDQVDAETGKFDEHKAFLGFPDKATVRLTYDAAFDDGKGPRRRNAITAISVYGFKAWLADGDTTKPLAKPDA